MHALNNQEKADFDSIILFPDQVVYPEHRAVQAAHRFILKTIHRSNLRVKTIPKEDVAVITQLESEKYRKSLRDSEKS